MATQNRTLIIVTLFVLAGSLAIAGVAQNRMQYQAQQGMTQPVAHMASQDVIALSGVVTNVNMTAGQGMPYFTLKTGAGEVTIMVGPYRLLMNSKFEIKAGQALDVKAFKDPKNPNAYVATELSANGTTISLRDGVGMPHAAGNGQGMVMGGGRQMMRRGQGMMGMRHGGNGITQGMGACSCGDIDLSARTILAGTVTSVNLAPGQGTPTFVLDVQGKSVTVHACPYHALLDAGFEIAAGHSLTVVAYPVTGTEPGYVAAELSNSTTQKSLKLRDEKGQPLQVGRNCAMNGNCPYKK